MLKELILISGLHLMNLFLKNESIEPLKFKDGSGLSRYEFMNAAEKALVPYSLKPENSSLGPFFSSLLKAGLENRSRRSFFRDRSERDNVDLYFDFIFEDFDNGMHHFDPNILQSWDLLLTTSFHQFSVKNKEAAHDILKKIVIPAYPLLKDYTEESVLSMIIDYEDNGVLDTRFTFILEELSFNEFYQILESLNIEIPENNAKFKKFLGMLKQSLTLTYPNSVYNFAFLNQIEFKYIAGYKKRPADINIDAEKFVADLAEYGFERMKADSATADNQTHAILGMLNPDAYDKHSGDFTYKSILSTYLEHTMRPKPLNFAEDEIERLRTNANLLKLPDELEFIYNILMSNDHFLNFSASNFNIGYNLRDQHLWKGFCYCLIKRYTIIYPEAAKWLRLNRYPLETYRVWIRESYEDHYEAYLFLDMKLLELAHHSSSYNYERFKESLKKNRIVAPRMVLTVSEFRKSSLIYKLREALELKNVRMFKIMCDYIPRVIEQQHNNIPHPVLCYTNNIINLLKKDVIEAENIEVTDCLIRNWQSIDEIYNGGIPKERLDSFFTSILVHNAEKGNRAIVEHILGQYHDKIERECIQWAYETANAFEKAELADWIFENYLK